MMQEQEYLVISTATEMVRLQEQSVVCITSDGNYSHICAIGGETFIVSSQLGQIEQLIGQQLHSSYGYFIRIGRGLIINLRYLCYINISKHKLYLLDTSGRKYVQEASREALIQLKSITENMKTNG
jgi:DNA-binding LytR/AlgR family response regulator